MDHDLCVKYATTVIARCGLTGKGLGHSRISEAVSEKVIEATFKVLVDAGEIVLHDRQKFATDGPEQAKMLDVVQRVGIILGANQRANDMFGTSQWVQ